MRTRQATSRQQEMVFRTWGGRREGAGRKPTGGRAGVPHLRREGLSPSHPVHVTLRVRKEVWSLRSRRCFRQIERAFIQSRERFGMRLTHYSVQGNHLHLIVEAAGERALSRGMQGLCIRIAKGLNRTMQRKGKVFADRYHAHILRKRAEVRNAVRYVLQNVHVHARRAGREDTTGPDRYSSLSADPAAIVSPRTWLLRVGWKYEASAPGAARG